MTAGPDAEVDLDETDQVADIASKIWMELSLPTPTSGAIDEEVVEVRI